MSDLFWFGWWSLVALVVIARLTLDVLDSKWKRADDLISRRLTLEELEQREQFHETRIDRARREARTD